MSDTGATHGSGGEARFPGRDTGPRPNLNAMYVVLFSIALFGFVAIKTFEGIMARRVPEPQQIDIDAEAEILKLLNAFPWINVVLYVFFGLGATLLLVYFGLRLGGVRPVGREPLNKVSWTLGALVKGLVIAFFMMVVISVAASIMLSGLGLPKEAALIIIGMGVNILTVVAVLFMLRYEYGVNFAAIGLSLKKPLRNVGYAFLTYIAMIPVFAVVGVAWKWFGEQIGLEYEPQIVVAWLLTSDSVLTIVLVIVSAVVVAPIVEEFFFRCFTYPALRRRLGVTPAILITSAYFALIHLDFFAFMPVFVLGVALGFLYERRQNIVAPAAMHFFHNARAIGLILLLRFCSQ